MLEDISLMRTIPNMTVLSTSDDVETKWAVREISKINGPVYLRLCRLASPVIYDETQKFEIGKGIQIGNRRRCSNNCNRNSCSRSDKGNGRIK